MLSNESAHAHTSKCRQPMSSTCRLPPSHPNLRTYKDTQPTPHTCVHPYFICTQPHIHTGLIAKLGSHPLDVAKKRYQVAGLRRSLRYGARVQEQLVVMPLMTCLANIYNKEGVAGLWKGSVPSIVKAAPAAAITFTAYEAIIGLLLSWQDMASGSKKQTDKQL